MLELARTPEGVAALLKLRLCCSARHAAAAVTGCAAHCDEGLLLCSRKAGLALDKLDDNPTVPRFAVRDFRLADKDVAGAPAAAAWTDNGPETCAGSNPEADVKRVRGMGWVLQDGTWTPLLVLAADGIGCLVRGSLTDDPVAVARRGREVDEDGLSMPVP